MSVSTAPFCLALEQSQLSEVLQHGCDSVSLGKEKQVGGWETTRDDALLMLYVARQLLFQPGLSRGVGVPYRWVQGGMHAAPCLKSEGTWPGQCRHALFISP